MSSRQLPAKVLKRVGQIQRLGAGGLVRTAYVRMLGPSVYRLTDPARRIAAALYRQRTLGRSLDLRLERLKHRCSTELAARCEPGRKYEFGDELGRFVQTLEASLDLGLAGCSVAKVQAVDWEARSITLEAVNGGASVERGDEVRMRVGEVITAIHRAGYVVGPIGRDGVAFPKDGEPPVVIDLRHALPIAGLSRDMSIELRDEDRSLFNSLFGTHLLTAAQLRNMLSPSAGIPGDRLSGLSQVYAPVVLRDDIRWGKIWNTDLGIGRWNFIMKDHLPIPVGGSVLDLGSNNGFNPLQMLRAGAASAVGIEIDRSAVEQAKLLRSAFEWLDNRSYDFRCIHGSQGDLAFFDLQRFDVVTAFCSLYYLEEQQIRDLVRYVRTRTDLMVLQCNTDRLIDRGGSEETFRKASVGFSMEMLEQAGFRNRQVIAPPGYSRPLVIGRA